MFTLFNKKLFNVNNNINKYTLKSKEKKDIKNISNNVNNMIEEQSEKLNKLINYNIPTDNKIETFVNDNIENYYDTPIQKINNLYDNHNFCK